MHKINLMDAFHLHYNDEAQHSDFHISYSISNDIIKILFLYYSLDQNSLSFSSYYFVSIHLVQSSRFNNTLV